MKKSIDDEFQTWDNVDEEEFQKWVNTDEFQKWAEESESIDEFEYRWNMTRNKALPSQFQLATLAASLDTPNAHPDAVAQRALTLWKACGKALDISDTRQEYTSKQLERLEWLGISRNDIHAYEKDENGQCPDYAIDSVSLVDFLKPHFSKNSKQPHMIKKFRDFLQQVIPDILDDEKSSLDKVASSMHEFRERGVWIKQAADLSLKFEKFLQREEAGIKKERAQKGGIARKEKAEAKKAQIEAEKAAKKTAVKKNSLDSTLVEKKRPKQKKAGRKQ
ncbi:MAG: hypothetical protein KGQ87_07905 [Verrucomicrobia bacterium]|nr:hypothetical protein [Verrucomicrobiota bacterium]